MAAIKIIKIWLQNGLYVMLLYFGVVAAHAT
jgi:hypothetical protein